jgi:hypothetical protein
LKALVLVMGVMLAVALRDGMERLAKATPEEKNHDERLNRKPEGFLEPLCR